MFTQEEIGELIKPVPPVRNTSLDSSLKINGDTRTNSIARRRRQFETPQQKEDPWPDHFLAEFNDLIANEISELTKAKQERKRALEKPEELYKNLLNELGISSGLEEERKCVAKDHQHMLNSDYDEPRDRLSGESLPEKLTRKSSEATSDYDEPLQNSATMFRNSSSSLPTSRLNSTPKNSSSNVKLVKPSTDPMPRSTRMLRAFAKSPKSEEGANKLPPFHDSRRKASLPTGSLKKRTTTNHYGKIQKVKPSDEEPDYEEIYEPHLYEVIGRSKSLENNNCPRSAPSTPTEAKKSPFSKFLRKHKYDAPIYKEASSDDAILVRVSSLPDQDLVTILNDHGDDKRKGIIVPAKYDSLKKKRPTSPLSLSSDSSLTGKRLSELDKDVTQISPVEYRSFKTEANDVAVGCDFPESDRSEVDGNYATEIVHTAMVHHNGDAKQLADDSSSRTASVSIYLKKTDLNFFNWYQYIEFVSSYPYRFTLYYLV